MNVIHSLCVVQIALRVCLLVREKEDLKLDRWGGSRRSRGMGVDSVKKYFQFQQMEFDFWELLSLFIQGRWKRYALSLTRETCKAGPYTELQNVLANRKLWVQMSSRELFDSCSCSAISQDLQSTRWKVKLTVHSMAVWEEAQSFHEPVAWGTQITPVKPDTFTVVISCRLLLWTWWCYCQTPTAKRQSALR